MEATRCRSVSKISNKCTCELVQKQAWLCPDTVVSEVGCSVIQAYGNKGLIYLMHESVSGISFFFLCPQWPLNPSRRSCGLSYNVYVEEGRDKLTPSWNTTFLWILVSSEQHGHFLTWQSGSCGIKEHWRLYTVGDFISSSPCSPVMQEFDFLLCSFVVKFIPFEDDGTLRNTGTGDRPSWFCSQFLILAGSLVKAQIQIWQRYENLNLSFVFNFTL